MPFILANAWLASALMEFPDLCLSYMANDGGLASAANLCRPFAGAGRPMTYLSWDESPACVLA